MAQAEILGMRELSRKISAMAAETSPKVTAQALRAAIKPMLDAARQNAPVGKEAHRTYKGRLVAPGFLKRNVKLKKLRRRDKNNVAYGLWAQGEAWYGQIVEAGRKGRKGNPWLGRAYSAHKDEVLKNFEEQMSKKIIAASKRIAKKYK